MKIHLIAIDPQKSFVDPRGSLFVPGGDADMDRLASLIGDISHGLDAIHITLDQHHGIDISHPYWFATANGDPAKPITLWTYDDQKDVFVGFCPLDGSTTEYRTRRRAFHEHTKQYVKALAASGRYQHTTWPEHCLIGTEGATVHGAVADAVLDWGRKAVKTINWVAKGSNPMTEHFSAVKAEVPQPNDPSTQVNTRFIQTLEDADLILLSGEALSHCVANTGRDIVAEFSDPAYVQKIALLTDCCSNVPGFETLGQSFIDDMRRLGMKTMTAADARALVKRA